MADPKPSIKGLLVVAGIAVVLLVIVFALLGDSWGRWFRGG